MKTIISLLLVLSFCVTFGQKKLPIKEVKVVDGGTYEYTLLPKQDSLRWYNGGGIDTFKVSMRFTKLSKGMPLPDAIYDVDNALDEYQTIKYTPQKFAGDNIVNPLGWNFAKGQLTNVAHYKNTLAFIETDGWLDFTCTCYKIEWYAEVFESYGIAGVSINKGPEVMVDLYQPVNTNNSTVVFVADSLDNTKENSIRIRYTGQRNPNTNSTKARINIDKFMTYTHQGSYYPPPSETKK